MDSSYRFASRMTGMRSSAVRDLLRDAQRPGMISLAGGLPAPELFDVEGLRAATAEAMASNPTDALQYGLTDGQARLKAQLTLLMQQRGVPAASCGSDSMVVTTGSQQALDLIARVFINPGDTVVVERPTYLAALQTLQLCEASFKTIDTDADGACIDQLTAMEDPASLPKLVYLVTNFGNPSGATLSLERRLALLRWAARHQVFVIEDDPYGELRYRGTAIPPLVALAHQVPGSEQWCGYISSLSKIVAPGLRLGWMVLPHGVREAVLRVKQGLDLHTSSFAQEVAACYLASGRLTAHLESTCEAYRARNEALIESLDHYFGQRIQYNRPDGGMFLWARLHPSVNAADLLPLARDAGVIFVPGVSFYAQRPEANSLRLSFVTAPSEVLREGISRLRRAFDLLQNTGEALAA